MIDWNALGTWAAVVVALGISLKEAWYRRHERSVRHLLVVAELMPVATLLRDSLRKVHGNALGAMASKDQTLLAGANDAYANVMTKLSLEPWRARLEQQDALPEHILIPLYKAITVMRMLKHNSDSRTESHASDRDMERAQLVELMQQGESVSNSLSWVIQHGENLMNSRRWRNPEYSAGFAILPK